MIGLVAPARMPSAIHWFTRSMSLSKLSCAEMALWYAGLPCTCCSERVELLLHLRRRLFAAIDHRLRVGPDLLHLPQHRRRLAVAR